MAEVLCVGIIVADHVCTPIDHVPASGELVLADSMLLTSGGCAANTAVDLAKMGIRSAVIGRVGNDLFGKIVREMLTRDGVDTSGVIDTTGSDTSQTLIVNVKGEDRRFIHTFGANACLTAADISLERLQGIKILYVGGYLLMPALEQEGLLSLFQKAQALGVRTVLDVGVPRPGEYLSKLTKLLPFVDVFLPNDDEAEMILEETDPYKQAMRFQEMGAKTVVITRGEHGSILVNEHERLEADIFRMNYVDGSGSGDAFDAGFIAGMLLDHDARGCLSMASALGASCVRSVGTTPSVFTRDECNTFLKSHQLVIKTW